MSNKNFHSIIEKLLERLLYTRHWYENIVIKTDKYPYKSSHTFYFRGERLTVNKEIIQDAISTMALYRVRDSVVLGWKFKLK